MEHQTPLLRENIMIRWDNVIGAGMLLLGILAVAQLLEVLSIHGPNLIALYEQVFRPELRPLLWLEVFVFAIVVLRAIRISRDRKKDRDKR